MITLERLQPEVRRPPEPEPASLGVKVQTAFETTATNSPVSISLSMPDDIKICVNRKPVLCVVPHGADGWGVYRSLCDPSLADFASYDEAVEWGKQYCLDAMARLSNLLWIAGWAEDAAHDSAPTRPLHEHAAELLQSLRAEAWRSEGTEKLVARFRRFWAEEKVKRSTCDAKETKRSTAEVDEGNWWNRWFCRTGGKVA